MPRVSKGNTEQFINRRGTRECKYPVVFIPKCRRKAPYKELQPYLGAVFRALTKQKECRVEEGNLMPDHVHRHLTSSPTSRMNR